MKAYVTLNRTANFSANGRVEDYVNIFDEEEALARNWIKADGSRVWVIPPEEEKFAHTFVWGFNSEDEAISFYETLTKNQLGINVVAC